MGLCFKVRLWRIENVLYFYGREPTAITSSEDIWTLILQNLL